MILTLEVVISKTNKEEKMGIYECGAIHGYAKVNGWRNRPDFFYSTFVLVWCYRRRVRATPALKFLSPGEMKAEPFFRFKIAAEKAKVPEEIGRNTIIVTNFCLTKTNDYEFNCLHHCSINSLVLIVRIEWMLKCLIFFNL